MIAEIVRQIDYQRHLAHLLGWRHGLRYRATMLGRRFGWGDGTTMRIHPAGLLYPIDLRIGTTDADVYRQIFLEQEYAAIVDPAARVIVDCGANVGYTSAYLLSRMPDARVVAIEPFPANAALCRRNLAPYGSRATVIEAAIWSRCTRLVLDHPGGNEWGVQVRAARPGETGELEAIDIPSLGLGQIDILKVDIEGSEADLFGEGTEGWLPDVRSIAIELHGAACERVFEAAMAGYASERSQSGELMICRGITPRRIPA